jgi:hypothetical protein
LVQELKAGIVMGIVAAVVALLMGVMNVLPAELLPIAGVLQCCGYVVILALWFVAGILAARFARTTLTTGGAAGVGAVAGAITQVIGGVVDALATLVVGFIRPSVSIAALPPEAMRQLTDLGMSPQDVQTMVQLASGPLGAVTTCLCCAGVGALLAAGLGALGGLVGKAMKK